MAQRATVLVPKTAPVPKRAGRASARAPADTISEVRPIAVDFKKLLAPYKKRGRLMVRVESMPPQTRFSAGRNNGDNSWSLALDELDDLEFLPAPVFDTPAMLAIRIVAHDSTDAETLAVIDFEISPEGTISTPQPVEAPSNVTAMEQLRRLRDEMAELARQLAEREADLEHANSKAESAHAELTHAREAWQKDLDTRLSAAAAQMQDARTQSARHTEDAHAKAEHFGQELSDARKALAMREAELAQLRGHIEGMEAATATAVRKAIATAENLWKAGEAARLAAAEAQWREQSEQTLAKLRAAARTNSKSERGESVRLHGELAVLRAQLSERDTELARSRAAIAEANGKAEMALTSTLNRAKELWKAEEAARLAAAHAQWREQSERALAEARAAASKSGAEQNDIGREIAELRKERAERQSELDRQRKEAEELRQYLAKRDDEIEQLRATLATSEPKAEQAVRHALLKAEETWKAGEAQGELGRLNGEIASLRSAIAERDERAAALRAALTQSEHALAEARATAEKIADDECGQRERQNNALADLRNQLGERDGQIAQLQSALTQAGVQRERDLIDAREASRASEGARFAAAEVQWREQLAALRGEHQAERERIRVDAATTSARQTAQHHVELQNLRGEVAKYREMLNAREADLDQARTALTETEKRAIHDIDTARADAERDARERFQARLAEAAARYEAAESALVEMRIRTGNHTNEDSARLLDEINALRSVVANRESELAQLRPMSTDDARDVEFSFVQNNRGVIFAALVAASMVMGGVLLFPQVVPLLPYDWQVKFYEMNGQVTKDNSPAPAKTADARAALPQAIVFRGVNLRADPSTKGNVISTLVPGTNVAELENRGSWTRVRVAGAKPHEGWVFNTFLKPKGSSK